MAKRVRRTRRLDFEKPRPSVPAVGTAEAEVAAAAPTVNGTSGKAAVTQAMMFNLADEYYHVYRELRNILIITAVMFAVMVGLSFVI